MRDLPLWLLRTQTIRKQWQRTFLPLREGKRLKTARR